MKKFDYILTEHCIQKMQEREILLEWVEKALFEFILIEDHPIDPTAKCVYVTISEYGDRILKVVYNFTVTPCAVMTVHFDRRLKGRL